jgi:hypothetical protein
MKLILFGLFFTLILDMTTAIAEVLPVDQSTLDEIRQTAGEKGTFGRIKLPKDSEIRKAANWGGPLFAIPPMANVDFRFPRAQAAFFAANAKEKFIPLDSSNWRPELFNAGVLVEVSRSEKYYVFKMDRIVCVLPNDSVIQPVWTVLDTVEHSDPETTRPDVIELRALFPLQVFNLKQDLQFFVFGNAAADKASRSKPVTISAKDLAKER